MVLKGKQTGLKQFDKLIETEYFIGLGTFIDEEEETFICDIEEEKET